MTRGIGFAGNVRDMRTVLVQIRRAGMQGLTIASDAQKIQAQINRAATLPRKAA